jgi:hypothetical protein
MLRCLLCLGGESGAGSIDITLVSAEEEDAAADGLIGFLIDVDLFLGVFFFFASCFFCFAASGTDFLDAFFALDFLWDCEAEEAVGISGFTPISD